MKHSIISLPEQIISEQQIEPLMLYQKAVFQWEKKTDLIGSHDKEIFFDRHILNALNLLQLLRGDDLIIHDVGTGAGLPGIVCRLCDDNLNRQYILYEKKYQKRTFLRQMIIQFNLKNIEVREKYPDVSRETSDVLTSRAYLGLQHLDNYKQHFKKFILFKGKNFIDEINLLNNSFIYDKIKIYKAPQDDSYLLQGDRDECFT